MTFCWSYRPTLMHLLSAQGGDHIWCTFLPPSCLRCRLRPLLPLRLEAPACTGAHGCAEPHEDAQGRARVHEAAHA